MEAAVISTEAFLVKQLHIPKRIVAAQAVCDAAKMRQIQVSAVVSFGLCFYTLAQVPHTMGKLLDLIAGDCKEVLEIGTLGGISALWLAGEHR
jgi:predicted O-methyltransferase YrrM